MNMKYILAATLTIACIGSSASAQSAISDSSSASRCPAGNTGCTTENWEGNIKNAITKGNKTVLENQGDGSKPMIKRVEGVKDTLKYCLECSMDTVSDAARKSISSGNKAIQQ